jgi:P-type Cu+ transporter
MLTGDNAQAALSIGQALNIPPTNIISGVLPSEKADKIRLLQN